MRRLVPRVAAALVVSASFVNTGCWPSGSGDKTGDQSASLAVSVVPNHITTGDLALQRDTSKETKGQFRSAGKDALVGDGGLWEIRRADELIGALQLSMLKHKVDVASGRQRSQIVAGILPNGKKTKIAKTDVFVQQSPDKIVYLWFRRQPDLYLVLQLKSRGLTVDPGSVAAEIIATGQG